ncbi:P-loop containing nucleoside triphosphate hydrolase [Arabidopsis thaliana x Arabidopsis arenosa]|uniref:P-loop containing nucleoside triphosphate hydrolase n=1 Tax=Arabidopsis thaliana x Arabidopsis arenosa TaxID=1240361 RepID=A0A8T1YDD8_9BRAS|nr:P-loop containing nucleoside triphosphate hydrolase [Arabidopsis thaliana x Arabidopsis arenosa]
MQYKCTVGIDFLDKELCIDKEPVTLQFWDTAGQERFHSIMPGFYRDATCCVLVYDVNILKSFESLDVWHARFVAEVDPITPEKDRVPFVLIGNKTDVKGGTSRVVEEKKAVQWCETKGGIAYFETSAKEKSNVDEAFMEVARKALLYVRRTTKM